MLATFPREGPAYFSETLHGMASQQKSPNAELTIQEPFGHVTISISRWMSLACKRTGRWLLFSCNGLKVSLTVVHLIVKQLVHLAPFQRWNVSFFYHCVPSIISICTQRQKSGKGTQPTRRIWCAPSMLFHIWCHTPCDSMKRNLELEMNTTSNSFIPHNTVQRLTRMLWVYRRQRRDIDCLDLQLCWEMIASSNCAKSELSRERHSPKQRRINNEMMRRGLSDDDDALGGEVMI